MAALVADPSFDLARLRAHPGVGLVGAIQRPVTDATEARARGIARALRNPWLLGAACATLAVAFAYGMGRDLAAYSVFARRLFEAADLILCRPLTEIVWNGPLEELTKTSNCQPALYVHGLACLARSHPAGIRAAPPPSRREPHSRTGSITPTWHDRQRGGVQPLCRNGFSRN